VIIRRERPLYRLVGSPEIMAAQMRPGDVIMVRDTTNREGAMLAVSASAWSAFLATIR
jgi:hypothetical protein